MDQKELVHSLYINGVSTMKTLLETLLKVSSEVEYMGKQIHERYSPSETKLYKLLNQKDPISVQFLSQKVDLNKVREHLGKHNISFAFEEDPNGVRLYFKVKDERMIAQALQPIIKEAAADLGSFSKKVLKKPGTMSFKEKVAYAQKHQSKYQGSIKKAPTVKAPVKS
ncbi:MULTISPECIES: DUF3801 domain-containing protein [Enterococcus]|jgi:hypothetical protein|uniref:DUF3801 domain-containing protein n=1 Tax=Enterococcus TaxID=1350 RepID=UPI000DF61916|nr:MULTISPECIES: DUF3801 domain-containing protein [Enterococcus]MDN6547073.1 hypothetical protein [Lactococcus lactis]AXG40806.1 hypothetical protein EGCR1_19050 [Enterococcus gilvus]MDN6615491.1 hypothetical protein [Enterococcus sp.]MDN6777549.1 hypothetical protein [Enterococcus sp.]MDU5511902.1 hypothetical protein [Enterococcus gilvus]